MSNLSQTKLNLKCKIIFRADGDPTIGMGHFIRTLALAEMLNSDFYCIYATQLPSTYQINEIEKVCHELISLPADGSHFEVFLNQLAGDEIVVLDNYYFTTEYQRLIKHKGCKLVCIDDMHDKHYVADIIINHAEGVSETQYSAEKFTKFCLGYKYALLRKEYLINVKEKSSKKYACLIMMGGADPLNLTTKLVPMIESALPSLPLAVIVGADSDNQSLLKQFKSIVLFKGIEAASVFTLMQESQFGIFPASTVAIEACAARLPFLCGYYVDNQKEIYNGIKNEGLAYCIDNLRIITPNDLQKAIDTLNSEIFKKRMLEKQKFFLDKMSRKRFIKIFQEL